MGVGTVNRFAALTFIVSFGIAALLRAHAGHITADPYAGPRTPAGIENLARFREISPFRVRFPPGDARSYLLNFEYEIQEPTRRRGRIASADYWIRLGNGVVHVHQTDGGRRWDRRRDWSTVAISAVTWRRVPARRPAMLSTTFSDGVSVSMDGPLPLLRGIARYLA